MLVSPTQKSGVGAIAQRQPPTPEFSVAVEYRLYLLATRSSLLGHVYIFSMK